MKSENAVNKMLRVDNGCEIILTTHAIDIRRYTRDRGTKEWYNIL